MKLNAEIIEKIHAVAKSIKGNVHIMEVCGTHTQVISHFGIRELMPKNVILSTGPGCPVCVTAQEDIDAIVNIAKAGIPVATYGDVLRVPGYYGSLDEAREKGAKVFDIYSTEDVLELQKKYPEIVFFGMGFETTTPMTAWAIKNGIMVYSTHKLFLPAMHALIDRQEVRIDGFLSPGHVATIVGSKQFENLKVSQVVTGFDALDVLIGIYMLLRQIKDGRKVVENEYERLVKNDGNKKAQKMIDDVFEIGDGNWRGFGIIPKSGYEIKKKYEKLDAKKKYKDIILKMDLKKSRKPTGCKCGEVIRGLMNPKQCPMFGKVCTPDKPYGPCMVSSEGGCNTSFRYNKE
jgi:hydrogenase expression/formation protein HypD